MTQLHTNTTQIDESPSAAAGQHTPLSARDEDRTRLPWYMAVLCRVAIHRGQWIYLAEGPCTQMRECPRCGCTKVRTKHQREWRYIRERTCEQIRSCRQCNATNGERTSHEWSESWEAEARWWQGEKWGHRCLRCGVVEEWTVYDGD